MRFQHSSALLVLFLSGVASCPIAAQPAAAPPQSLETSSTASLGELFSTSLARPLSETDSTLPEAPEPQASSSQLNQPANTGPAGHQQTKRILFIIPNFRSVSADVKLPPTTTRQKFMIATEDSFDYSAFLEVGILAGIGEYENSEPLFHQGAPGYARYYWHSFADNTDGNYMTEFIVPTLTREDPRYYTLGHGGVLHRAIYSVSRLVITRNNEGNATPNFSEIAGNGAAAAISGLYYPANERGWNKTGQRWVLQVGIDGLSDLVKEFWPDINDRLFHDKY